MLILLFIKHFIADFVLQTNKTAKSKHKYLYLSHSMNHGLLTFGIAVMFVDLYTAFSLSCLDFAIHHNVDYIKVKLSKKYTQADRLYWIYFGADQLLHSLTYVLIVYLAKI